MTPARALPDPIHAAASWLATGGSDCDKPVVPQLRAEFDLTALQAIEAIREGREILARTR